MVLEVGLYSTLSIRITGAFLGGCFAQKDITEAEYQNVEANATEYPSDMNGID